MPSIEEIEEAIANMDGWCSACQEFTADRVEPDAKNYVCPVCKNLTVYGAEAALIAGEF